MAQNIQTRRYSDNSQTRSGGQFLALCHEIHGRARGNPHELALAPPEADAASHSQDAIKPIPPMGANNPKNPGAPRASAKTLPQKIRVEKSIRLPGRRYRPAQIHRPTACQNNILVATSHWCICETSSFPSRRCTPRAPQPTAIAANRNASRCCVKSFSNAPPVTSRWQTATRELHLRCVPRQAENCARNRFAS